VDRAPVVASLPELLELLPGALELHGVEWLREPGTAQDGVPVVREAFPLAAGSSQPREDEHVTLRSVAALVNVDLYSLCHSMIVALRRRAEKVILGGSDLRPSGAGLKSGSSGSHLPPSPNHRRLYVSPPSAGSHPGHTFVLR
jgi:hypothetical protein